MRASPKATSIFEQYRHASIQHMTGTIDTDRVTTGLCKTDLGYVSVVTRNEAVLRTTLPEPNQEAALSALPESWGDNWHKPPDPFAAWVVELIVSYCAREAVNLAQIPVDYTSVPEFTRMAREACRTIPRGEVRTYKWLATQAGNDKASRAAGRAMATNPVPLLVPCHRVVGSDGRLTGFGGSLGVPLKERLLRMESSD